MTVWLSNGPTNQIYLSPTQFRQGRSDVKLSHDSKPTTPSILLVICFKSVLHLLLVQHLPSLLESWLDLLKGAGPSPDARQIDATSPIQEQPLPLLTHHGNCLAKHISSHDRFISHLMSHIPPTPNHPKLHVILCILIFKMVLYRQTGPPQL